MFGAPDPMPALPMVPDAPTPPPLLGRPQGTKPRRQSQQRSFLGGAVSPQPGQTGQATLMGQ